MLPNCIIKTFIWLKLLLDFHFIVKTMLTLRFVVFMIHYHVLTLSKKTNLCKHICVICTR